MDAKPDSWYLPTELWLEVIKQVTYVYNEGGVTEWIGNYDLLEMGRNFVCANDFSREIAAAAAWLDYATRRNLTLVSKTWNRLATPILYRSVFIRKKLRLLHFTSLLRSRPELKQFVIFLEFDFRGQTTWTAKRSLDINEIHTDIREIYRSCPNIAFFCAMGHGELLSLPIEDHPKKLQALDAANYLRTPVDRTLGIFNYLSSFHFLRLLTLAFIADKPNRSTPRLSLPNLEILSLVILEESTRDVDEYLSEAVLPKLHSLYLNLGAMKDIRIGVHPLDIVRSFFEKLGHQIITLMITDKRSWGSPAIVTAKPSFQLENCLPSLQQLIVDECISIETLQEMSVCSTIRILDICDPGMASIARYLDIHGDDTDNDGDFTRLNRRFEEGTIINKDLGDGFKGLRLLRFSSAMPDRWGREETYSPVLNGIKAFLKKHGKDIESRGVSIDLRLIPEGTNAADYWPERDKEDDASEDGEVRELLIG
jgi:hypothetical protein